MRQVGVIAAAGVVALETMVERMAEDHATARRLALGLSRIRNISIDPDSVATNLVYFELSSGDPSEIARILNERGIRGGRSERRWRFVTHYGITEDDIDYALILFEETVNEYAKA